MDQEKLEETTQVIVGFIVIAFIVVAVILVLSVMGGESTPEAPPLPFTPTHVEIAYDALAASQTSAVTPKSIELNDSGFVAITYEMDELPAMGAEAFAQDALLAVRNALYVLPDTDKDWMYRVSIHGPSPGPGLVRIIGTMRFRGGGFDWRPGDA